MLLLLLLHMAWAATPVETDVFRSGEGGYHTYRIPALITTSKGTLLAFCEGRRNSSSDSGDIDLLMRRSMDNGKSWSEVRKLADFGEDTIGNPTPVIDWKSGAILLLLTRNAGNLTERQITTQQMRAGRSVWIMRSGDDGVTWSEPREITSQTKKEDWTWYATGPGNGIQLRSGRLVVPCDHNRRENDERHSHVIYSDDGGENWKIGGIAEVKTNESAVVETRDGGLLLNMRSYHGKNRRAVQRSKDGGLSWGELQMDEALIEPVCEGSMISGARPGRRPNGQVLFSNPAATDRSHMTVRLSRDDGRNWSTSKLIYEGPSAYSSLAILKDGSAGLLYERGERRAYERITFLRFALSWLETK